MPPHPPWILTIHHAAADELADLPGREFDRIEAALARLEEDPFRLRPGTDVKKLKDYGAAGALYRLRVGERRVLYAIIKPDRRIYVLVIDDREIGYDRLVTLAERRM